jgi:hypothetical protein
MCGNDVGIMDNAAELEDRTFNVSMRRQVRFGDFKIPVDPVGFGYQPRALLHLGPTEMTLTRVNRQGVRIRGSSFLPASWTWHYGLVSAQAIVLNLGGWGIVPRLERGINGLRLDIHGEAFYPLLATYAFDDLVSCLQSHGVSMNLTPRRLNRTLIGRR